MYDRAPGGMHRDPDPAVMRSLVRQFGEDANAFHSITFDLTTVQPEFRVSIAGNVLWAYTATSLSAAVNVRFQDQNGEAIVFQRGMMLKGLRFDQIFVSFAAQPGETITFFYGKEEFGNLSVENPLIALQEISGEVTILGGATLTTTADDSIAATATEQVLAANASRRSVVLSNPSTNTREFRYGDSNTGASRGAILEPGESATIETTAAVYVYNPNGVAQSLGLLEVVN